MGKITFLGDVSLLSNSMKSEYSIDDQYVFNLEYVVTNNCESFKEDKVNLYGEEVDLNNVFGKNPLAVSLANNHIMDCGIQGFKDTLSFLEKSNIDFFGANTPVENYNNPVIKGVGESRVALISYSLFDERIKEYGVALFDEDLVKKDIALAKSKKAESIIVNIHWGEEESPLHNNKQKEIGRFFIDQGANLVIGHHPHCVQPFEIYRDCYIFYSIGNCIFPSFSVDAFYDYKKNSKRKFRKRQLKYNKVSYAIVYDVMSKEVVAIDKLIFDKSVLRRIGSINLKPSPKLIPQKMANLIKKKRKYQNFIWSNVFVDGRLFDLNTLKHEIQMKKSRYLL